MERSILEPEFLPFDGRGAPVEVIRQYIETQGEKRIEHNISFPDLSNRRTEDIPWKNIWLLSFSVQPDA